MLWDLSGLRSWIWSLFNVMRVYNNADAHCPLHSLLDSKGDAFGEPLNPWDGCKLVGSTLCVVPHADDCLWSFIVDFIFHEASAAVPTPMRY
jgi:hypothetical protein